MALSSTNATKRENVCLCFTLYHTVATFNDPKIEEKEEYAGSQHFLLFPTCFLSYPGQFLPCRSPLICRLQLLSIWTSLKYCRLVKNYGLLCVGLLFDFQFSLIQIRRDEKVGKIPKGQATGQAVEILTALKKLGETLTPEEEAYLQSNSNASLKEFEQVSGSLGM